MFWVKYRNFNINKKIRWINTKNKKLFKYAFFCVVFPMKQKYLDNFFTSLKRQTFKDFDLYVINDRLSNLQSIIKKYKDLNIFYANCSSNPPKLREFGLKNINSLGYKAVIFGDVDDYFAKNRVQKSIELLKNCDIVINDVNLVDYNNRIIKKKYFSKRISNGERIRPEFIMNKNIFGLSNTAIRGELLKKIAIDKELIATDWFIFSVLLNEGHKAIFTNETLSFYRQHKSNVIGINKITNEMIVRGIMTKLLHYRALSCYLPRYKKFFSEFKSLFKKVKTDRGFFRYYADVIKNSKINNLLWWEQINIPEEINAN